MNVDRKHWNEQQQALRQALSRPEDHALAVELFLAQHAMVHAAQVSGVGLTTFEDEVWEGLEDAAARCIPPGCDHSIAWCFWHLTRIEDVTMNILLAGTPQLLFGERWFERTNVPFQDTGNGMPPVDVARLGAEIDLTGLRDYRLAVGRRTREIVQALGYEYLKRRVDPSRLERILAEEVVSEAGRGVVDYWSGLTGAGLLLMPPTRHALIHLNEAGKLRQKCRRV